jgi:hypothetical protein
MRRTALALAALLIATPALAQDIINPGGTNASALSSGTVPASRGGAGTINGALKGNGSGVVSQAACADLSNGGTACSQSYTASTWTPTLVGTGTSGTGQTYLIQVGTYEQVGRQVTARFHIQTSSVGTAAGNVQIGGLPVAAANTANDHGTCMITFHNFPLAASNFGIVGFVTPNTTLASLFTGVATASDAALTITQYNTVTSEMIGVCFYHT